jgi:putative ABC transport system ATP-binding protein
MAPIIELRDITKQYDAATRALDGVTISINEGEWTSIMGPSGSGKTTLLNIIGCLDSPTGGSVKVAGTEVTELSQKKLTLFRCQNIGLIFQQYHLIPYLTALENVLVAQYFAGAEDEQDARKTLEDVGMGRRLDHLPAHLSGGEQQRVCIARALVNAPRLLLADEPTGNLDSENGRKVLALMKRLHKDGHSIVMVTHSPEVASLGDRIIRLVDGKIASDEMKGESTLKIAGDIGEEAGA